MKAVSSDKQRGKHLGNMWKFELKLDGFRCLYQDGKLLSERGITQNHKFPHIESALSKLDAVLDGEVALDGGTIHEVNRKENWSKAKYYVFDLLEWLGDDLRDMPLVQRQNLLSRIVAELDNPSIEFVREFEGFEEGWEYVVENGCEGLIAKHKFSAYPRTEILLDEVRSKMWLKIKHKKERVFVMERFDNHEDDTGITFTDGFHRFSCRGENSDIAKQILAEDGKIRVEVQYLYETEDGHLFQPVVKRVGKVESVKNGS